QCRPRRSRHAEADDRQGLPPSSRGDRARAAVAAEGLPGRVHLERLLEWGVRCSDPDSLTAAGRRDGKRAQDVRLPAGAAAEGRGARRRAASTELLLLRGMTLLDRVALGRGDLLAASFGLALSALLVAGVQREGAQRAFLVMFGSAVFVAVVVGFMRVPHVLVAATIVYFSLLPTLKVFVTPLLGGTKDIIDVAAVTAAVGTYLERRRAKTPPQLEVGLLVP